MKPCPSCGKHIDILANSCPNCGRPEPFALEDTNRTHERVNRELRKEEEELEETKKRLNIKSNDEIRECYREARNFVSEGKFLWALNMIISTKTNYNKKKDEQSENELRKISEELNMTDEFILWKKSYISPKERERRRSLLISSLLFIFFVIMGILIILNFDYTQKQ